MQKNYPNKTNKKIINNKLSKQNQHVHKII